MSAQGLSNLCGKKFEAKSQYVENPIYLITFGVICVTKATRLPGKIQRPLKSTLIDFHHPSCCFVFIELLMFHYCFLKN